MRASGNLVVGRFGRLIHRPATVFVVLSLLFGLPLVAVNPPLRGPDEAAHFVRAYGIGHGVLVPSAGEDGRYATSMAPDVHDDFAIFLRAERTFGAQRFSYREIFATWRAERARRPVDAGERPPVLVRYEGAEAYSPAAYLPHAAVVPLARVAGLDFVAMSYLMRAAGLIVMTGVLAYAIASTPWLKWSFVLIGLLPAALYGRAVIGADGGTQAYTMVVVALCLRVLTGVPAAANALQRSVWLALSVLSKPPQLVFVLLESMTGRARDLLRRPRTVALVVLPSVVLGPLWVLLVSGEIAAWRMAEGTGRPAHEFDPMWKLRVMVGDPLLFPTMLFATLTDEAGKLWRQLIGVLGRLDTPLWTWTYPVLTALLLATCLERLTPNRRIRVRLAAVNLTVFVAYTVVVYLIMFMTWTPMSSTVIWGVQGRYFIVVLPSLALVLAAAVNRCPGARVASAAAITGAAISGVAAISAVFRTNW